MKIELSNEQEVVAFFDSPQELLTAIEHIYLSGFEGCLPVFEEQSVMFIGRDSMVKYSWRVLDDEGNVSNFFIELEEINQSVH